MIRELILDDRPGEPVDVLLLCPGEADLRRSAHFTSNEQIVALRMKVNLIPVTYAFASFGTSSNVKPTLQGKVHTLRAVEAEVETCVVAARKCDDELA